MLTDGRGFLFALALDLGVDPMLNPIKKWLEYPEDQVTAEERRRAEARKREFKQRLVAKRMAKIMNSYVAPGVPPMSTREKILLLLMGSVVFLIGVWLVTVMGSMPPR